MGKKLIACFMAALLLCGGVSAWAAAPEVTSQSVCVMDADTGQVLYEKDAKAELPMASITKVMTALLVLENGDLGGTTTATDEALATVDLESTRVGFVAGEQLTIDELMYCMMVYSANDAANILAEAVGGSVDAFVERMNQKAQELGCTHTHFVNPNGLDADGHYTCAYDMALITRAANQYPEFAKYSGATSYSLPSDNVIGEGWQVNTKVDMLDQSKEVYDHRVYAAKTGWTTNAHNTFVACAKTDNGNNLIVTLLNCPMKNGIFTETTALLNYADEEYPAVTVAAGDYEKEAQKAAKEAGVKTDTSVLEDFTLHLPKCVTAENLAYRCDVEGDEASLQVTVASDSRKAYEQETGKSGDEPLLSIPLTVEAMTSTDEKAVDDTPASGLLGLLHGLPQIAQDAIRVAAIVLCAIVIMIVLLFLLGLYRRIKRTQMRRRNRAKYHHNHSKRR